jgi:hypothetical protein
MAIDFNSASSQGGNAGNTLIPDGTVAPVILSVRGEKRTKAGDATMLDCEFTVTEGEHKKRKFWKLMMVTSNGSDGHNTAVAITHSTCRAILESAYGINPVDDSETAIAARRISDWSDLSGLEFVARIGIEPGKDGYKDKNILAAAVTPDEPDYAGFTPAKPKVAASPKPATSNGTVKPAWA